MLSKVDENRPYALEIELQGLPKTTNGSHQHWRVKHAQSKAWKTRVFALSWPKRPAQPLKRAKITYTRFSSTQPDFDNLVISFKAIQDGLRQAGIIADDKQANVIGEYCWFKAQPKSGRITVRVEELSCPAT